MIEGGGTNLSVPEVFQEGVPVNLLDTEQHILVILFQSEKKG